MTITRVWIEPGCIACGLSEETCPEVFRVTQNGAEVIPGADLARFEQAIRDAAEGCPAEVIKFTAG